MKDGKLGDYMELCLLDGRLCLFSTWKHWLYSEVLPLFWLCGTCGKPVGVRGRMPLPEEQCRAPTRNRALRKAWQHASDWNYHALCIFGLRCCLQAVQECCDNSQQLLELLSLAGRVRGPQSPFSSCPAGLQCSIWVSPSQTIIPSLNLLLFGSVQRAPEKVILPLPPKLDSESMASSYLFGFCSAGSCCTSKDAVLLFAFIS